LEDEDVGGGESCEDPKAPGVLEAPGKGRGGGGGGGGDPEGVLVLRRGSCDLHGFCRTQFPTFIIEESLSCQL
ncbi:hypothetical protein Tco_1208390, partial [Tanacetum coccineum]